VSERLNADGRVQALLARIPRDADLVTFVGDGDDDLIHAYRTYNPAATVHRRPPSGGPLNRSPAAERESDVLVLADALAQASDPARLLADHQADLAKDGTVVACLPNARYWRRLDRALAGGWDYADGTPLGARGGRAFTPAVAREMVRRAGLEVSGLHPLPAASDIGDEPEDAVARLAQAQGVTPERVRPILLAESYVVVAVRRLAPRLQLQAMTLRPQGACIEVRVSEPMAALATRPEVRVRVQRQTAKLDRDPNTPDKIFFWQRPILTWDQLDNVRRLIDAGYLVVTEFDDHPMRWPAIEQNAYLSFRAVHAVQTSTPALAGVLGALNPTVGTFPNGVAKLPPPPEPLPADAPVRVFFGALNRAEDWRPMVAAINAVLARHPGRLHVEVIHDRAFFDALETPDKTFTPTCGYDTYKAILGRCQLALMPLEAGTFNAMKSDLKFVEAAAHGAVALASPTVYAETIRDGETGVICQSPEAFADALEALARDPERRLRIARAAWQWVRDNRMLADQIGPRLAWYRDLLARRQELSEALYARVPQLRG
jgi:glycosyltransferase involved in cell wall biosynthesis